eukprot:gene10904-14639_t
MSKTKTCEICEKESSLMCGKCMKVCYCCKDHQKTHWKLHKLTCNKRSDCLKIDDVVSRNIGYLNLPICMLEVKMGPPNDFPRAFKHTSANYVSDGKIQVSKSSLFTWGVNTCLLLILWGEREVCILHLSGWNAPGNPLQAENINLASVLPANFKYVKGVVIPGQNIDPVTLQCKAAPGESVLAHLLTSKVFAGMDRIIVEEWCQNLQILSGLRSCYVVRVSAENQLVETFANPNVPDTDCTMC